MISMRHYLVEARIFLFCVHGECNTRNFITDSLRPQFTVSFPVGLSSHSDLMTHIRKEPFEGHYIIPKISGYL